MTDEALIRQQSCLTRRAVGLVASAAADHAIANGWPVAIAIVDAAGLLLYFERADRAPIVSIEVAIGKARSAALQRKPTADIEAAINGGRVSLVTVPGLVGLTGGRPLVWNGIFVGGLGVSGVAAGDDDSVAMAGAAVLAV
jgi:glc operon protein GlcG